MRPASGPTRSRAAGRPALRRYAQTWSGDNETAWKTLRFNLDAGAQHEPLGHASISGTTSAGSMGRAPDAELFCRFVEFCSLWPRFVMNSWKDNGVVNLPWMHESVIAAGSRRHRAALPAHALPLHADVAGLAPERARRASAVLRLPERRCRRAVQDSFMLGPDILVAPVLDEGATDREVYLPEHPGGWFDIRDGRRYAGGSTIVVEAPLGRLPVLVRSGAMIPVTGQTDRIDPGSDRTRGDRVRGSTTDVGGRTLRR